MSSKNEPQTLTEFLARHVKPYDPDADHYDRPPFAADIKEGKNDPIYNAHSYHTKVPPRGIIPYILHYTEPGDLILDPFCGSGMTGVAAQMCANPPADILQQFPELKARVGPRACILKDLSPAACHIAYNYNKSVDFEALKREFERIKAAVKDEFNWLYGTEHYEPAVGLYDSANPDVASRLKNPPGGKANHTLLDEGERTWELLTKAEVEARLGYSVTELPRHEAWGDLDVANIEQWVCIPATIQYTIWSDVYRCEGFITIEKATGKVSTRGKNAGNPIVSKKRVARGCGEKIVLWDAAVDSNTGELRDVFRCPSCNSEWSKQSLSLTGSVPVRVTLEFNSIKDKEANATRKISRRELTRVEEIHRAAAVQVPSGVESAIDLGREMMRHGNLKRGLGKIRDFYTPRNLRAVAKLWRLAAQVADARLVSALQFTITSIINTSSRMRFYRPSGPGDVRKGTLYVASLTSESNVLAGWVNKFWEIFPVLSKLDPRLTGWVATGCGSATTLAEIPDGAIDYVFADPPFGSNIYYADCSLLWESWLDRLTDEQFEMVVSDRRKNGPFKTLENYKDLMRASFDEMFRVLKPGRWATIEFNNSDGKVFEAIKEAVRSAGFEITNMLLLDKAQKSFKQIKGAEGEEDVVDKDVLFNLHKPAVVNAEVSAEDHDLERQVAQTVRQHLQTLPERIKADPAKYNDEHRTTATINSMLMNTLIPRGVSVERLNLPFIERVCARYFRKVGLRWYLRGEAVGGNGGGLVQEEVGVKDETSAIEWLRQKLESGPMLIGELKPLWMRATGLLPGEVSQSLVLENLLTENFWRDADTNRWREPTTEERERINDDRSLRVLHDAERFVNNTLNRPTTGDERCKWIDVLFQACRAIEDNEVDALPALRGFDKTEAYGIIPRLFQSILRDHVSNEAYTRVEKQARAASQRIAKRIQEETAEQIKAKAGSDANQGRFDFDKST